MVSAAPPMFVSDLPHSSSNPAKKSWASATADEFALRVKRKNFHSQLNRKW